LRIALIQSLVFAILFIAGLVNSPLVAQASSPAADSWPGAELFTNAAVCEIQIEIRFDDLQKLRNESREFVRATITQDGAVYRDVAVHLKGSVGSFRPLDDKPGFTLDFARFQAKQRFHGLRRIHLNNSVEDPSYCNEQLGSELFRAANIPAPRVSRAIVTFNKRKLGLYVLKEGFTEDFLSCYFRTISDNLFEPGEGHDVNQHLKRCSVQAPSQSRAALHHLGHAVLEPDPAIRWQRLQALLDVDQFLRFMSLEVMLCHRDGYCLARNNFRLYEDVDTGKLVFFPHGMDQLFGIPELPWAPHMAGLVGQAVLAVPEGRRRYRDTFKTLFEPLLVPEALSNRVIEITRPLRSYVEAPEFRRTSTEAASLSQRILERYRFLKAQLERPVPTMLEFNKDTAHLTGWMTSDEPKAGQMDQHADPDGVSCLRIIADSESYASWRTKVWLTPGHYRFEGKARVENVKPLSFGAHQGAGLRVSGQARQSPDLIGTSSWQLLAVEFQVSNDACEFEFICELRAIAGQACFDCSSLQLIREH
jgi:hypothetical protein